MQQVWKLYQYVYESMLTYSLPYKHTFKSIQRMETTQICILIYVKTIDTHTNRYVNPYNKYGDKTNMYINLCENL